MSSGPADPRPAEVFRTFVSELAASRQAPDLVDRHRPGHEPDRDGWCGHPAHAHRWERYPCAVVRLATLVGDAALRERFGACGRARAVERFSVEAMARSYEALYDRLVVTDG